MKKPPLPFVGTPEEKIETILKFTQVKPGQKSVDLGAGDGRVVIAMAKAGAIATGFEIQQKYVRRAKMNIAHARLTDRASVSETDFWQKNLSGYDIVTIYGMAVIMKRVAEKLLKELKPGTRVISNGFPLPGWKIEKEADHVYLHIQS
jgi:ribosomal protein L11 methylase PrmA